MVAQFDQGLDFMARQFLMAAYLYERHSVSPITDAEFDALGVALSDNWEELSPFRRWCLESRAGIRSTGHGIRCTMLNESGAIGWAKQVAPTTPILPENKIQRWVWDHRQQMHWSGL